MSDRFDHRFKRKLESDADRTGHGVSNVRRIEVITGTGRRRRWSSDDKARIVEESLRPGANVSEVARRNGLSPHLDQVEPVRDVLADPGHLTAATGTKGAVRLDDALNPGQMRGQLATVAVAGRSAAGWFAFDGGFGLFFRGIENTLRDLDVFQQQVALVGAQLLGFGAEPIAPKLADDDFEPAPRLFHLGKRGLRLRQKPSAWHSLRTGRR